MRTSDRGVSRDLGPQAPTHRVSNGWQRSRHAFGVLCVLRAEARSAYRAAKGRGSVSCNLIKPIMFFLFLVFSVNSPNK